MRVGNVRPVRFRVPSVRGQSGLHVETVHFSMDGTPILRSVDLSIAPGEFACLLGPSGCGKTTLLRVISGLEVPDDGSVSIGGRVMSVPGRSCVPPEERGVGFLFQDYALFPHLHVLDNVCFGLEGRDVRHKHDVALQALESVGMASYAKAWPHTLSGGQQQRVALARALAPNPSLMLLDEPFSGLDRQLRDQVRQDTLRVLKSRGVSALMVTHDPEEAMFMSDVLAVMDSGRIVQCGTPVDVYCHPKTTSVARFFCDSNVFSGYIKDQSVSTPLGNIPLLSPLEEGVQVDILIRPEGLKLSSVADGEDPPCVGKVVESRLLGRSSVIFLDVLRSSCPPARLCARVSGFFLPPPDEYVAIELDRSQIFVFPSASL